MQNQLVEQLLSQMLQQQQPNIAKGGFLGQIALAAALRSQMKQAEQKQQAQQAKLVDVIQPDAPTTLNQVFGQQSPQNQRYWGKTKPLAEVVDAKRAALGTMDPATLQGVLAKQMFPEPEGTKVVGNELVGERSGRVIYTGKEKPVGAKSPVGKVMDDYKAGIYGEVGTPEAQALLADALDAAKRGGVTVTQVNNPRDLTTGAQTDVQKDIVANELLLDDLSSININQAAESLSYMGAAKRAWYETKDKMNATTADEKNWLTADQKFRGSTERAFLKIRKEATGAQAVLAELKDLRKASLDATGQQSPTQNVAAFTEYRDGIMRALRIQKRLLDIGITDPGKQGELMDQAWQAEKYKDEQAKRLKEQLKQGQNAAAN